VNSNVAASDHIVERTERSLVHSETIAARRLDPVGTDDLAVSSAEVMTEVLMR
jgi:hypothetical protein